MTRIINLSEIPVLERTHARAGLFRAQALLAGLEGSPDNFFLQLSQTFSDFASPRHRHNFDQVRVQLKSDADFARDGVMQPGMVAYFPEGVFYGPQSISGESLTLVLQLGGASGAGDHSARSGHGAGHLFRRGGGGVSGGRADVVVRWRRAGRGDCRANGIFLRAEGISAQTRDGFCESRGRHAGCRLRLWSASRH